MPGKWVFCSSTSTMRDGSENGSGRNSTPFTTVKIAVFAPIPRPSVTMATAANPAFFVRTRSPYLKSRHKVCIRLLLPRPPQTSTTRNAAQLKDRPL